MTAYVWKIPARRAKGPVMIVSCAETLGDARSKIGNALLDPPECLKVDGLVAWVNEQPPALEGATDDPGLALYADLYV